MDHLTDRLSDTLTISRGEDERDASVFEVQDTHTFESNTSGTFHDKADASTDLVETSPPSKEHTADLYAEHWSSPMSSRSPRSSFRSFGSHVQDRSDDEDSDSTAVVESTARLIPACWQYHPLHHKGKDRSNTSVTSPKQPYLCGEWEFCYEHVIVPPPAAGTSYRISTTDPKEDLERYVLNPNDALDGTNETRTQDFVLKDGRYDRGMLFSALEMTVEQIRAEVAHIGSLFDYAARMPYDLSFRFDDEEVLGSIALRETTILCSLLDADREKLGGELIGAVEDLDFLKERAAWVGARIVGCNIELARMGDWAEIAWLTRMGAVDGG